MSKIDDFSKDEITDLLMNSKSIKDFIRKIGYAKNPSGNTYKIIRKYLSDIGISEELIKRVTKRDDVHKLSDDEIFVENSNVSQRTLRRKYEKINNNYICSICKCPPIWNKKPLSLILDHINGINNDNRLTNLRWVCPNCNSQLETTGSRNIRLRNEYNNNKKIF